MFNSKKFLKHAGHICESPYLRVFIRCLEIGSDGFNYSALEAKTEYIRWLHFTQFICPLSVVVDISLHFALEHRELQDLKTLTWWFQILKCTAALWPNMREHANQPSQIGDIQTSRALSLISGQSCGVVSPVNQAG